jgi:hypothetical protein
MPSRSPVQGAIRRATTSDGAPSSGSDPAALAAPASGVAAGAGRSDAAFGGCGWGFVHAAHIAITGMSGKTLIGKTLIMGARW